MDRPKPERRVKYVYALCEPVDDFRPRYVGLAVNLVNRWRAHQRAPTNDGVARWLASLPTYPRLVVLETLSHSWRYGGHEHEVWWIRYLLRQGHDLLNRSSVTDYSAIARERSVRKAASSRIRFIFTKHYHEQARHRDSKRRRCRQLYEAHGKRLYASDWAKELGISRQRIHQRLRKFPVEIALAYDRTYVELKG